MALWTLKTYRCLVIEDFAGMRNYIRGMLTTYGAVTVDLAKNGEEAIAALEKHRYELVLCDYNLGRGRDGQQVLEEARHRGLLPHATVFLMVTAENTADMVMGSLECQPDGYLSKPVTKTTLQARLKELLDKRDALLTVHEARDRAEPEAALVLCEQQITAGSRHRMTLRYIKARLLLELGRYQELQTFCEQLLDERDIAWVLYMLGQAQFHRGEPEAAKRSFEDTLELNSDFVTAYDWLARVCTCLDQPEAAERALSAGVLKSPKSLSRQRALAAAADQNGHTEVAHRARRDVVRAGTHSVHLTPGDHTAYARALVDVDRGEEAVAVLDAMQELFPDQPGAMLEAAVCKAGLCSRLGQATQAEQALECALNLSQSSPATDASVVLELVCACLEHGRREAADELTRQLVRNNHDNDELLSRVVSSYEAAGAGDDVQSLVTATREQTIAINNDGIKLLKAGRVGESIELFTRALEAMPLNPVVNLNTAYALTQFLREGPVSRRRLADIRSCLDTARAANADPADYDKVMRLYQELLETRAGGCDHKVAV